MEKEILINGRMYKFNMVNKRSRGYEYLETLEIPIELEEIYDKFEFGNVKNIGIVRELLRGDSLNLNKDILGSVELYNATAINSALLPYVLSCDVDMLSEFRKTLRLLKCYDELKNHIDVEISLLKLPQQITKNVTFHTERNMLLRGYILLRSNSEAVLKRIVKKQAEFYQSVDK